MKSRLLLKPFIVPQKNSDSSVRNDSLRIKIMRLAAMMFMSQFESGMTIRCSWPTTHPLMKINKTPQKALSRYCKARTPRLEHHSTVEVDSVASSEFESGESGTDTEHFKGVDWQACYRRLIQCLKPSTLSQPGAQVQRSPGWHSNTLP